MTPIAGRGPFDNQQQVEAFLSINKLEGPHDEVPEALWDTAGYSPHRHGGYRVTLCFQCGQPTILSRESNDTRCGRYACSPT